MNGKWYIFYGDGGIFSSENGESQDAPCVDVIAVVQQDFDMDGKIIWSLLAGSTNPTGHHFDWYWRCNPDGRGEFWWAGTLDGFLDQAMRLRAHSPKQGRTVHNDTYVQTLEKAIIAKTELDNDQG